MIGSICILLTCQLLGEAAARLFNLPVPGPLVGMAILFAGLIVYHQTGKLNQNSKTTALDNTANVILTNLSLLFVPAAVGIMQHLPIIKSHGLALGIAIIGSTLLTLIVSVLVFRAVSSGGENAE